MIKVKRLIYFKNNIIHIILLHYIVIKTGILSSNIEF